MRGLSSVIILSLFGGLLAGCDGAADSASSEAAADLMAPELEGGQSGIIPAAPEVTHTSMAPQMDGLLAYYALDGDATDGGPSAIDGVVLGTTPVLDRFGISDGALSFQSLDDHVAFDAPIVGMNLTSMSVSLWFQSSTTDRGVIFHEGKKQGPGFQLRILPGKNTLMARSGGAFTIESESAYNDGGWHHVVVTGDGLGAAMWVDGALVVTHEGVYEQADPMPFLPALGRDGGSDATDPKDSFVGAIDDVSVFNRPLSADEAVLRVGGI